MQFRWPIMAFGYLRGKMYQSLGSLAYCLPHRALDFVLLKPIFHFANLFVRTDKKVGMVPTCSRRIFSPANFNQSGSWILVFASRRCRVAPPFSC